jgi:hypothetical protein
MRPQLHIAALYLSANDAALQRKTLIRQAQEHLSTFKAEFLFHDQSSKKTDAIKKRSKAICCGVYECKALCTPIGE